MPITHIEMRFLKGEAIDEKVLRLIASHLKLILGREDVILRIQTVQLADKIQGEDGEALSVAAKIMQEILRHNSINMTQLGDIIGIAPSVVSRMHAGHIKKVTPNLRQKLLTAQETGKLKLTPEVEIYLRQT